ncbi:MAG: hypothetical protein AAGB93_20725 [Planctomycetota bacterium]
MRLLRKSLAAADDARRGAALLLAFLVLIVIIAIVYQINTVTLTDERITYNEITRSQMDLSIEAVLLQTYEDLKEDAMAAEAAQGDGGGAGAAGGAGAPQDPGGGGAATEGEAGEPPRNPDAVDSMMDRWFTPQSTNFGDVQIRIFIRDENSKYNVLNMLDPDEELAEIAYQRVVRVLDNARGGTDFDISAGDAEEMARAMRDYMESRFGTELPTPELLTSDQENEDRVVPFTFAEFRSLEPFEDNMFEDFFTDDDQRIHAISSFLTVFTSPSVGAEEVGSGLPSGGGGFGVNVNTAPHAVLTALFDSREIDYRIWDEVREYRNEEEEPLETEDEGLEDVEPEPLLDEYGNEVLPTQIFDSLDELDELYEFDALNETEKASIRDALEVTSDVFEIVLAARISTAADADQRIEFESRREQEEYFRSGEHIVRIIRSVIWRRPGEEEVAIVPLVRWEVLENAPLKILDFPDDE